MEIKITKKFDGTVLKDFLIKELNISHRLLTSLKKSENGILQNGTRVTVRAILREGDLLSLHTEDNEPSDIPPVKMDLDILYEDDDMIAVAKPPFLPTHPSIKHYDDTLANGIAYYYKSQGKTAVFRPITRLDKNTSGVVIIAKNARAAAILSHMMKEGKIKKTYIAVADGSTEDEFSVESGIKRANESIILRTVCANGEGQYAKTTFRKLCEGNGMSVLKVTPLTGRTHQIRVHLAHIGHPITGDDLYGKVSECIDRHALHAEKLTLCFPDGRILEISAPLPEDMKRLLELCINT